MSTEGLGERRRRAVESIRARAGRLVVALSGGVDSAVLTALAVEALGRDRVLAVTGRSASLSEVEDRDAARVAEALGVPHAVVETHEMDRPGYRANAGDRCFHCREELFDVLGRLARERGYDAVAYGAIADDVGDFRPGMRSAELRSVLAPLLDAGLGKADVRALAAEAGLPVRDKPASACLASRLPLGTEVSPERLRRIEAAERALRDLGFVQLRVRDHGEVARLELDPEGDRRLAGSPALRGRVVEAVRAAGFRFVALDLEGYRRGSLNPEAAVLYRIEPARDGGQ